MGGELEDNSSSHLSYSQIFDEAFPYYLSIGMSYEDYWYREVDLVRAYRKAEKLRFDRMNRDAWIQGMYVYEAIADVSPVLQAFAKKGTTVKPYSDKPYEFTQEKKEEESKDKKIFDRMQKFASKFNKQFVNKGGKSNGHN